VAFDAVVKEVYWFLQLLSVWSSAVMIHLIIWIQQIWEWNDAHFSKLLK